LAAATFRASDIMMRRLTDAQYIHHPADLRIQHEMHGYHLESFWAVDEIVALGEENAEAALQANPALLARLRAASSEPLPRRHLPTVPSGLARLLRRKTEGNAPPAKGG
jgi:hypothetical protein